MPTSTPEENVVCEDTEEVLAFKNKNFVHKALLGNKKRTWKSVKQIVAMERALVWPEDAVLYGSIDAPPSFKPAKKYSDISGLKALYSDPLTSLHYRDAEEFAVARRLPQDVVSGLLELRGAASLV